MLATAVLFGGCAGDDGVAAVGYRQSETATIATALPGDATSDAPSAFPGDESEQRSVDRVPRPGDVIVRADEPRPTSVAVVGDSLTVSATEEIESALDSAGFDAIDVDGQEGRRMTHGRNDLTPGVDVVADILTRSKPELWVIALGTNDVASVDDLSGFRSEMRSILDLLPPDADVIWVDLWIRDRSESIIEANQLIRTELRAWSADASVVDWHDHGLDDGVITADGVHLTQFGQQLFADSIADAIDEMFSN
ncbi:MAG: SGNH/GDSL hydrolase family protein [Ilumatobacteraceae bacterium]